jgi:hypothetical protein
MMSGMSAKTCDDLMAQAIAHEERNEPSAANAVWNAALALAMSKAKGRSVAVAPGTVLVHLGRRGDVLATCYVDEERRFVVDGRIYTSISAAALAASRALGNRAAGVNGKVFWGLK